jgi:two-component system, cell cycle sensor histidine kinase and response regulator CckA
MAMPYLDGAATIRALRKISPTLPIIAASGLPAAARNELDINAFLAKPYTAEKLLKTLSSILQK